MKKLPENFIATIPPTTVIQKSKKELKEVTFEEKQYIKEDVLEEV